MPPLEEQEVLNLELKRELVVLVTLVSFILSLSLFTFISFPDMTTDDMGVFFASRNRQCDGSLGNGRQV